MARNRYDVDENSKTKFNADHLKRTYDYVKRHKRRFISAMMLRGIVSIIPLFTPLITGVAINQGMLGGDIKVFLLCCAAILLINVAVLFLENRTEYELRMIATEIVYDIRMDIFKHLQELPFSYYDDRPHGKILVRVLSYVETVASAVSGTMLTLLYNIISVIFITIFMLLKNFTLGMIILTGVPVSLIFILLIQPWWRKKYREVSNALSNLHAFIQESINGVRITQIFNREEENDEILENLSKRHVNETIKTNAVASIIGNATVIIKNAIEAAIYVVSMLVFSPSLSLGDIYSMTNYNARFWGPFDAIAVYTTVLLDSINYLERIFETLDEPVEIDDAPDAYELPQIAGEVEFKNVTFGYTDDAIVLKDLSFKVKPGESIALVGPTGAGKSTIVNLISRFYDVQGGQVCIDGHDVKDVTLHSLRKQMGIMLQESFIFGGTIAENIRYGNMNATDEQMREACRVVHIDEYIESLKDGYETVVQESGGQLSQGQKQLVAFARTIITNPKILILDEATSAIDTKTEQYVQEGINHLLKGRTSFIIAHRLSTIRNCDKIMYVDGQTIKECGTHDELIAKKGYYYELYISQSKTAN